MPTAYTYTVVSTFYILLFSCFWTIYSYEFDEKCICAPMLAFQGIIKFHSILNNRREIRDLCDFSLKIYKANTKSSFKKTCLEKSVKLTVLIFKYGMCLLVSTSILVTMKPYISYILFGEVEPILPTYFPGINEQKAAGYTILAVFHTYLLSLFVVGTAGSDLALMTFVIHCHTMSKIFNNDVNDFNHLVQKNKPNTPNKDVHASLRNLILMHTVIKLLKTIQTSYFPAYFLMVTAFFQVFEYSVLGTIVEISSMKTTYSVGMLLINAET